jgi:PAS domain S-box-containing protein
MNKPEKTNNDILKKINLSCIFEYTSDSVWAINSDYEIIYLNGVFKSEFQSNFGIKFNEGSNFLSSLPVTIRQQWKSRFDKVLLNDSSYSVDEFNSDADSMFNVVCINPIKDNGQTLGVLFIAKNISKKKGDEIKLSNSKLLLKASLESQKDTILFSINQNYEYLYFNSAHQNVMKYAYGIDVQIGMNVLDCMTNIDDRATAKHNFDRALAGESHSNIRVFGEENKAYYESFFNPIRNEKNEIIGATGLARDITQRKESELALEKSEKDLKEINSTKDRLFSIIGHDLRSPFNSIIGFSNLLLDKVNDPSFSENERFLKYINNSANQTLVLLDNLLIWARSQTGTLNVNIENIFLSDVVSEVINLNHPIAFAKEISLNYSTIDEYKVRADKNLLKTILRNLISNAIKFTHKNGEVNVNVDARKDFVEVKISDNGIGINKDQLESIFNLSADASSVGTANEKGSGLGLQLCKDFVGKLNGEIRVDSIEGKGSDFIFTLPLVDNTKL